MQYKVKVRPEDFYVRELASISFSNKGVYGVFRLRKVHWNTVDVIKKISKTYSIPLSHISYGGKKDKHALTEQFITIKYPPRGIKIEEKNFSLQFLGFTEEPMSPAHINGNFFSITLRAIPRSSEEHLSFSLGKVRKFGFVNYFDDQRFGSYDPNLGFIAEKIIKQHLNGALKIYLTHIHPEDKREAKERKKRIYESWGNWRECLKLAKREFEKFAFSHLIEKPKDFLSIIKRIPKEELSMFFSAFQSFLWNELVRRLILKTIPVEFLLSHRGITGDYIFIDDAHPETWKYFKALSIPTVSSKVKITDKAVKPVFDELLKERGIRLSMFNLRKIRQAFFSSVEREVIVVPQSLEFSFEEDEIYQGKRKLILRFVLPRGSYGTMLVKRIFSRKINEGGDKNALLCSS